MSLTEHQDLLVDEGENDTRLDAYLCRRLHITRSAAAKQIDKGQVLVDGKARKSSFKLKAGMKVNARIEPANDTPLLAGIDLPFTVLYEDSAIIVINKPAGLVVHPGAGENQGTLVNALIHRYPEISNVGATDRPGIVHRLDKLTSGVMVVARSTEACEKLAAAFKEHSHSRIYLAICYGHLGESAGRIETLMQRNPRNRKKMSSKVSEGRRAATNWQVLKKWDKFSLLELSLETGRTHQIRVHLADMGHPVVGDPEYGGKNRANTIKDPLIRSRIKLLGRQMLHACKLGIVHPITGQYMEFSTEPPEDFQGLVSLLDERAHEIS